MTQYFGDFAEDATVYIPFNTFSSDDPSASVTITNLADADIKVHKDGSATQIVTDGATVSIDFDSITGNHLITIDTSAHADYSTGSDYMVRMEGTTIDGATVNAWIGSFSIENRFMRGTDSAYTGTPPTAAAIVNEWETQSQADPTGFHVNVLEVGGTAQTANDNGADINTLLTRIAQTLNLTASGNIGIDWANIENPATVVDLAGTDINLADTVTTNTDMRGTDNALLASSAPTNFGDLSITATTGRVDLASIEGGDATDTLFAVDSSALSTYDPPTKAELDAGFAALNDPSAADIVNEWETQSQADPTGFHVNLMEINSLSAPAVRLALSAGQIVVGAAETGTLSTTQMTTDLTEATDDHYIGRTILWTSGVLAGQATDITDYAGTNGLLTFTATTEAPSNTDAFIII